MCPECMGDGCSRCGKTGHWDLMQCPLTFIDNDVIQAVKMAELYEKGLPPVDGGVMDQAGCFLEMAQLVWAMNNFWKKKLKIPG